MADPWTIKRVLEWAAGDLDGRGTTSPRLDAELMLSMALGCDRIKLIIDSARPLDKQELGAYKALHKRRRLGEPIAYLRGEREFFSRRFVVDGRALVPRPETEILVEVALRPTRRVDLCARVLDLCTGSGCVAITLKKERPTTHVIGNDISDDALALATQNGMRLGAHNDWVHGDLYQGLDALRGKLDLVTANPPYVSDADMDELPIDIREYEPAEALRGGPDGLVFLRRIIADAPMMLCKRGVLAVEVGAGQAPRVGALFEEVGFRDIQVDRDYGAHERVVSGVCA